MAKKTLLILYYFQASSNEYLIVLMVFLSISFLSLYLLQHELLYSMHGFAYPSNDIESTLQINTWTLPNNEDYWKILNSSLFNYTMFKTIVLTFAEKRVLESTLQYSLLIHLSSVIIPIIPLARIYKSEAIYIVRSRTKGKIHLSLLATLSSIILILPFIVSVILMYNFLLSWLITSNIWRLNLYIVAVSLTSASISTMIFLATRREEVSYFYGFTIPLLMLFGPEHIELYFPIGRLIIDYSPLYLTPYLVLYALLVCIYCRREGV